MGRHPKSQAGGGGDPRLRQLFQTLRSALDLVEDIVLRPLPEPSPPASPSPRPRLPVSPTPQKLAFSIREIRALTGISRTKLYTEIQEGRLRPSKAGRRTLILAQDLQAWLDSWETTSNGGSR